MRLLPVLDTWKKDLRFSLGVARKKPFQVLVQVTNRCNMECSFCDFWPNPAPKSDELTADDYERVAGELSELGCFLVSIEGGEPFIRKDLPAIVRAFGKSHIPALFTNGWFVTRDNARALWDNGLVHASVSIDYPDQARHDGKRRIAGTTDRAWRALETFRDTAPRGGKQVHVMTVLMDDNWSDMEPLFEKSAALGVGHQVTLLSVNGFRRGKSGPDKLPPAGAGKALAALFDRFPHVRFFREYFDVMDTFLAGEDARREMPECRAGVQSFNIDHIGDVSPCIEKIDRVVGNVKSDSLRELYTRLAAVHASDVVGCQQCWTACRGMNQALGQGGSVRAWMDMTARMRTT